MRGKGAVGGFFYVDLRGRIGWIWEERIGFEEFYGFRIGKYSI